ncbi:MAG TPA: alkaline phosphatase D family protein, partial [Candidatus Hydrogenedentes bacterium]|nr:alkaline phosphatase D family protein [Candidatus Hydrogenedentota bacterium]
EVTPDAAMVWARLTRDAERVPFGGPMPIIRSRNDVPEVTYPEGASVDALEGACPGAPGEVRVRYAPAGTEAWRETAWQGVDPERDFTCRVLLEGLTPDTRYVLRVETRGPEGAPGQTIEGGFRTAPGPEVPARVVFTVTTGQRYPHQDAPGGGFRIYDAMLALDPNFFVHTGDILYYDELAKSLELARWHWARTYSLPTNVNFHRQVASYFEKDDHDTWCNDCWPGMETKRMGAFTFAQGQAVFLEQVPMSEKTYRTFRWGKDLQIWLVEGRDYRSANALPDGPEKTIWGAEQKAWFKRTVSASDAAFRVLISPTPLVGPDRPRKADNHANATFAHEGRELRRFIADQERMIVVCGDRHWQYVSVDGETGLREYSCGPASDEHAGGWKQEDVRPEHRYLNVIGGYLAVTVDREGGRPVMRLRHCGVDGDVLHEDVLRAE